MTAPWCYHFELFLGRRLSRADRAVISPLEQARIRQDARPVVVIDPPGHDSREILVAYLRYRLSGTHLPAMLVVPVGHKETYDNIWNTRVTTPRRVNYARGHTHSCVLLLDAHLYKTRSPYARRPAPWQQLLATLIPTFTPCGFFIIHLRAAKGTPAIPEAIRRLIAAPPPPELPSVSPIGSPGSLSGLPAAPPPQLPHPADHSLVLPLHRPQ